MAGFSTQQYVPELGKEATLVFTFEDFKPEDYATKEEAAKALYESVKKLAVKMGQDESEVSLFDPDRTVQYSGERAWCVVWEAGPYQWAIGASMSISGPWGFTEPYYSFDLHFTE